MEELRKFLKLLKRYRLILIIIPIVTVIITFFLVRNLANSYLSQAQIATGIVDDTKQNVLGQATPQTSEIIQEFSNLIAMMKMKNMLDQISYQLIIHDLTSSKPFRKPTTEVLNLDEKQKARAIQVYQEMYKQRRSLNLYNKEQNALYDILIKMKYDSENLNTKLSIFRSGDSDFIIIQYDSENPELSAFVVNELSSNFVKYYTSVVKGNQVKATNFLSALLAKKNDTLTNRMLALRDYKIKNRVLNLDEQSKQLYTRILQYEDKKQEATQNTSSYAGALDQIDKKFSPNERRYIESTLSKVNRNIVSTKDELTSLYDLYYKNGLDERYQTSIDSLNLKLTEQINRASDQYINNPLAAKAALIQQKMELEIKMDVSRYSIYSLERELNKLNSQFDLLVPKEAEVQSLEMKVDIASKEYLDILNRYNQSSLESGFEVKLSIVQTGMPGLAQPSKKMLLVILSGVISLVFCIAVLFVIYFLDDSITTPKGLANATQSPVLGSLSNLLITPIDLNGIWSSNGGVKAQHEFKNELRSLRYELEKEIKQKVILLTSIDPGEGKTLLSLSLAFAWKMTNHKVLLIDGNFNSPELTKRSAGSSVFLEDFFQSSTTIDEYSITKGSVTIMRNRGGDTSLMEITSHEMIAEKMEWAKQIFDIIIIEAAALDDINQSREWMLFCDGIIAVFKSGLNMGERKKAFVAYLKETGLFRGWILNKVPSKLN